MSNTRKPQLHQHVFLNQTNAGKTNQRHGTVRQDIIAFSRDRRESIQLAASEKSARSQQVRTNHHRFQRHTTPLTEPLTLHVPPIVKDRLRQIAREEGLKTPDKAPLSLSEVGGRYLARGLQAHMDMQYGALLEPVITRAIEKYLGALKQQLRWLLVRVAFDANQTRSIVTNLFSRQPGMTKAVREKILIASAQAAKTNIFGKTPQLMELVQQLDAQLTKGEEEQARRSR